MRLVGDEAGDDAAATRLGLTPMIKVEVVVDRSDEGIVRDVLLSGGATGYTALPGVSGFGHHGQHQGRLLFNDDSSLSMVISVLPPDRAEHIIGGIRRLLDQHHGVMFVSETYVSRPEYFTTG